MQEESKTPRYGVLISFIDNKTKEDVEYGVMSDNIYAIEDELKRMLKIVKDK
jgi:hypothetical protein